MRVAAVSGVDHVDVGCDMAAIRCAAPLWAWRTTNMSACMAERLRRCRAAFRPWSGTRCDVEIDDVGGKSLRRDLERRAGTRRGFEEQVEYRLAAQQRYFLYLALGDGKKGVRGVEDAHDDVARQALDGEQVMQLAVGAELGL